MGQVSVCCVLMQRIITVAIAIGFIRYCVHFSDNINRDFFQKATTTVIDSCINTKTDTNYYILCTIVSTHCSCIHVYD